jgi:RNA polymerase sporulation-specific sigma factor
MERDVFDLYITGMSVEQIAGLLGRDRKSVSNALYRMKGKIKGLLQNDP